MKNGIKIIVIGDLNISINNLFASLEREGYKITSTQEVSDTKTLNSTQSNEFRFFGNDKKLIEPNGAIVFKGNSFLPETYILGQGDTPGFSSCSHASELGVMSSNSLRSLCDKDSILVRKTCNYLLGTLSDKHTLKTLSSKFLTNRNTLSLAFKKVVGSGVFEWLRIQRMEKAALLLRTTALDIQSISYDVGYNDPANFSTAFKTFFGTSPKQYRDEVTQANVMLTETKALKM